MSVKVKTDKKLKACPFCGASAQLVKGNVYNCDGYKVKCTHCHVSTLWVHVGAYLMYKGKRDVCFTDEQAKQQAVDFWNRRVSH